MKMQFWLAACLLLAIGTSCQARQESAQAVWADILSRAVGPATPLPDNMKYLGLSNNLGPGTLWRYQTRKKGALGLLSRPEQFNLRYEFNPLTVTQAGSYVRTSSVSEAPLPTLARHNITLSDMFSTQVGASTLMEMRIGAALELAKTLSAGVRSWAIDTLDVKSYDQDIWGVNPQPGTPFAGYWTDLHAPKMCLMLNAVRIEGFVADIVCDSDARADLRAALDASPDLKINATSFKLSSDKGALVAQWTSGDTLRVSCPPDTAYYIAGQFVDPARFFGGEAGVVLAASSNAAQPAVIPIANPLRIPNKR